MKEFLWRLQPDANVETVQERVEDASNQLDDVDVMLAGVDQVSARSFLNEYAVRTLTPYIDAGSIIHTDDDRGDQVTAMHGYIHVIVPGVTACFDCLGRGNPDQERLEQLSEDEREHEVEQGYVDEATLAPEPAIIHLNSSVASKAVSEFVKMVIGFDEPASFLRFEDLANELVELATSPTAACVTCGDDGVLGHGHPDVADDPIDDEVDDVDESELPA
jgi:molybdopterin/thiamine biosynthesis adenylyltransferase